MIFSLNKAGIILAVVSFLAGAIAGAAFVVVVLR
jgi:hypothetical protein